MMAVYLGQQEKEKREENKQRRPNGNVVINYIYRVQYRARIHKLLRSPGID
jgi:hypothetical protein